MSTAKFIGALRAGREVNGLALAETEYASGLSIDAHPHAEPLCCVVLVGAMTERWGGSRVDCDPGTLTYQPARGHGQTACSPPRSESEPEAGSALDHALGAIAESYGKGTASLVALQLEYPWQFTR